MQLVDRTQPLHSGQGQFISLELPAGDYFLVCTVVEDIEGEVVSHEVEGMRATLHVTPNAEPDGETRAPAPTR
jgi:hypothetical protein